MAFRPPARRFFARVRSRSGIAARHALTLLELILVLALLVAVGAIVSPRLFKSYARQKVAHGGEILRATFNEARITAMRSGKVQMLTCELDSRVCRVRPWEAGGDDGSNARRVVAGDATTESNEVAPEPAATFSTVKRKSLPEGLRFVVCESLASKRSVAIEEMSESFGDPVEVETERESRPVLFYPDGSSSESQAIVADENGNAVVVRLRGLTGSSSVGEVRPLSELVGE